MTYNYTPQDYFEETEETSSVSFDKLTDIINNVIYKEEKKDIGYDFMKGMFGPVKGGMCRLTMEGGIAVKTPNGYKSYNAATGSFVNCDSFVFDIGDEMFFVIPTNSVQPGDIILAAGEPRYVLKAEDNMLTTINYKNGTVENLLPERHMFMGNTYFYGKVVSMFGNMTSLAGGDGAQNVMKYMMLSQMMKGMGGSTDSITGGMNPVFMMMAMNGGMGNMFDGLFNSAPMPSNTIAPVIPNSTMGKRVDVSVIDEYLDKSVIENKEGE